MALSFLRKWISWIKSLWAMLGWGVPKAPADMGKLFNKGGVRPSSPWRGTQWGRFDFSAEFCLTNPEARVFSDAGVTAGQYARARGRFRRTDCNYRTAKASRKNSKHQAALIFAGSPVTSARFQRDQKKSLCVGNPACKATICSQKVSPATRLLLNTGSSYRTQDELFFFPRSN